MQFIYEGYFITGFFCNFQVHISCKKFNDEKYFILLLQTEKN